MTTVAVVAAIGAAAFFVHRLPPRTSVKLVLGAVPEHERVSWQAPRLGSISYLEQAQSSVPRLSDSECLVGVKAIGLNYADVFCVLGLYEAANAVLAEQPGAFVPGLEYAGEVLEVGASVTDFAPGDRVYGFTRFGAYTTKVVVEPALLRKIPDGWSFAEAASLLVQGLTAWHGLVSLGGARSGSRVLVHSAAGGVGCAALEICDAIGADAIGVVGSESKIPFLQKRFPRCTPVVRRSERQYAAQLADVGGEYDVVLESLGGRYLTAALDRVAPMGRLVHFGATAAYGGSIVDGWWKWLYSVRGSNHCHCCLPSVLNWLGVRPSSVPAPSALCLPPCSQETRALVALSSAR